MLVVTGAAGGSTPSSALTAKPTYFDGKGAAGGSRPTAKPTYFGGKGARTHDSTHARTHAHTNRAGRGTANTANETALKHARTLTRS